jgi:hypothetical protein
VRDEYRLGEPAGGPFRPALAAELADGSAIEQIISETAARLDEVVKRLHRRLTWARTTRSDLHKK